MSDKPKKDDLFEAIRNADSAPDVLRTLARAIWHNEHDGEDCPCDAIPSVDDLFALQADEAGAEVAARYVEAVVAYLIRSREGRDEIEHSGLHWILLNLCGKPLHFLIESLLINGRDAAFARVQGGMYGDTTADIPQADEQKAEPPWMAAGALGKAWRALLSPLAIIEAVHYVWRMGQEGDWPGPDGPAWERVRMSIGVWEEDERISLRNIGDPEYPGIPSIPGMSEAFAKLRKGPAPDLLHPLAPLVHAWLNRPHPGEWDDRATAIIPGPFAIIRDLRSAQGELFAEGPIQPAQRHPRLPGFDDGAEADERLPFGRVVPLVMFDATGTLYESRGQGAPLALRFWIEAVTAPARLDRDHPVKLETSLRDLVDRLWPNGWSGPARDGEKLLTALRAIDGARIPWRGSDEGWRAVSVVNLPAIRNPDSPVVLTVLLPPGSERGPLVYRNVLREYGVTSAPLYRLGLAVAYLWDRYFTHKGPLPVRVPVVKRDGAGNLVDAAGKPVQGRHGRPAHWNHPRAIRTGQFQRNPELSRIPDLRADDLLMGAYPREVVRTMSPAMRWKALHQVREAAFDMAKRGHAVVSESGKARRSPDWRIRIEPPDWHGAPESPGEPASGQDQPASGQDQPASGQDQPASGQDRVANRRKT